MKPMLETVPGVPFRVRIASPERPLSVRGGELPTAELEVHAWGRPNADRSNAILLCHSFSADAFAAGEDPTATALHRPWRVGSRGWWDDLVGPGKPVDTDRFWIVCSNVLGGSAGSTGPSTAANDGEPWGTRFPFLSIADLVEAQVRLADILEVGKWRLVAGGSLGGLQTLSWAVDHPDRVAHAVPVAVAARPSLSGIGHFAAGCAYIRRELESGGTGYEGLLASFGTGRRYSGPDADPRRDLDWRNTWPPERYHPWTYVRLAEALITYDLAQDGGGGDLRAAAAAIRCPLDLVSFAGDTLFPPHEIDILADAVRRAGGVARHHALSGIAGHDTFLEEPAVLSDLFRSILAG
jgi:homoserine O-acetyltransferase